MYSLILFLFLFAGSSAAKNFALVAGGAAHEKENEFLQIMGPVAQNLARGGWQTTVLFDSDFNPREWNAFPVASRPPKPGQPDRHFTLANFNRSLEAIAAQAKSGDQVSIDFEAHGGVVGGRHVIDWHDARKHWDITNALNSLGDAYWSPTRSVFPALEKLLKKGVRVHLNTLSCYDGQIMKDAAGLLARYPDLFCMTTATSNDRSTRDMGEFFLSATSQGRGQSVEKSFTQWQTGSGLISSLPDWNEILVRAVNDPDKKDCTGVCGLGHLYSEPILRPLIDAEIKNIIGWMSGEKKVAKLSGGQRLRFACSEAGRAFSNQRLFEEKEALRRQVVKHLFTFSYRQAPALFPFGSGSYCPLMGGWCLQSKGSPDKLVWGFSADDVLNAYDQLEYEKNPANRQALQVLVKQALASPIAGEVRAYVSRMREVRQRGEARVCDGDTLAKLLKRAKNYLLSQRPQRPKACGLFRY